MLVGKLRSLDVYVLCVPSCQVRVRRTLTDRAGGPNDQKVVDDLAAGMKKMELEFGRRVFLVAGKMKLEFGRTMFILSFPTRGPELG